MKMKIKTIQTTNKQTKYNKTKKFEAKQKEMAN